MPLYRTTHFSNIERTSLSPCLSSLLSPFTSTIPFATAAAQKKNEAEENLLR